MAFAASRNSTEHSVAEIHSSTPSHHLEVGNVGEANLGGILRRSAARYPQKPAIIDGEQVVSYQAFNESTDSLACWFLRNGLHPGDRVAIHWCNSIEVAKLYFACFRAGLIAVPVNNRMKPAEIAYVLKHSKAKVCFSQPALAPLAEEVRPECPDLVSFYTALPIDRRQTDVAHLPIVSPERVAAILYTSGTTARPKGVMHTHISLIAQTGMASTLGLNEDDILLAATQMVHIAALSCVLLSGIACGATVVLLPMFDAARCLDLIQRRKCSFLIFLPAMLRFIVEEQDRRARDVRSVRLCLAGGDSVPVVVQEGFRRLFGVPVRELFGMTESAPITCIREHALRNGSLGPALEIVDTRVADTKGAPLDDNQVGELQVQSPGNCVGYWDDLSATTTAFRDGWLRTGDLVRRDADGFFWFEGRLKQIIVRGGSNISPQEVEEVLYQHPAVLEAGVVGVPNPVYGETVLAFVALREGVASDERELREFVRSRMAEYKLPERIVFLADLPKGLTGKVDRRALKEFAKSLATDWTLPPPDRPDEKQQATRIIERGN